MRSVLQGEHMGKRRRVRAMSEGQQEKTGIVPEKTTIEGGGEVEAVEVNQVIIGKTSLVGGCEDFGSRDGRDKGVEGKTGAVLNCKPVTSLPFKDPRKAGAAFANLRGTRSQTDPGRRSSRVEKTGREGL